jgi:hypothetical protein
VNVALLTEPLRVSVQAGGGCPTGHGMLIGLHTGNGLEGVVVNEYGELVLVPPSLFAVDWRYHAETDRWMDLDLLRSAETDQT